MLDSVAIKLPGITLNPKPPCLVKWFSAAALDRWRQQDSEYFQINTTPKVTIFQSILLILHCCNLLQGEVMWPEMGFCVKSYLVLDEEGGPRISGWWASHLRFSQTLASFNSDQEIQFGNELQNPLITVMGLPGEPDAILSLGVSSILKSLLQM